MVFTSTYTCNKTAQNCTYTHKWVHVKTGRIWMRSTAYTITSFIILIWYYTHARYYHGKSWIKCYLYYFVTFSKSIILSELVLFLNEKKIGEQSACIKWYPQTIYTFILFHFTVLIISWQIYIFWYSQYIYLIIVSFPY